MHDNPPLREAALFALSSHSIVTLSGRDAVAFAQAQFTNDVALIESGQWQWSGWLTPKGRVIALFALLRLDDETIWLVLPDAHATPVAQQLSRFLFRSKLSISAAAEWSVAGAFARPAHATGNALARLDAVTVELDFGGEGGPRRLLIGTSANPRDDGSVSAWKAFDLRHGLPRLSATQAELWTPQQLSLERLKAFSVKKGCYPGQEIVARTHFLGKAKRALALLESQQPMTDGSVVEAGDSVAGSIISTAEAEARCWSLAVLPMDRNAAPFNVHGQPADESPLLGGLAR